MSGVDRPLLTALCITFGIAANIPDAGAKKPPSKPSRPPLMRQQGVLREIEALDRQLVAAEAALIASQQQRQRIERQVADTQSAQATASLHHADATQALGRRLGALMRQPEGLRWVVLTGSHSLSALVDEQRLMQAVAHHDRALWGAVHASQEHLRTVSEEQEEQAKALRDNEASLRTARDRLGERRRQRAALLQQMQQEIQRRQALANEQRLAKQRLSTLAQRRTLRAPKRTTLRLAQQMGHLPWPARGRIRTGFGDRVELTFGTTTSHNGLDIAAPAGSVVQAVADGQVVWADWLHGYGQVVIVDHHDGYHAVMAHLAQTEVALGERVQVGQPLGTVGDTGSLRGTVLYFEIRRRGRPVDPRTLLGPPQS